MADLIRTVLGDIPSYRLGYCHSHEHIWITGDIDDYDASLLELCSFKKSGGDSIVDCQPLNAGGNVEQLMKLSWSSGVNIIASVGFHLDKYYPNQEIPLIKYSKECGVVKVALDVPEKIDKYFSSIDKCIEIASDKKLPMIVHTEKNADIIGFLGYLSASGIPYEKVIICHLDRSHQDTGIHREAAARGCYIEYDTIARYKYHDDSTECGIIKSMIDSGYENSILLGLDTTKARLKYYGGTPGLSYIKDKFEEVASEFGIDAKVIRKFMVDNPGKAFVYG